MKIPREPWETGQGRVQALAFFDDQSRHYMGISGDEFIARLRSGEFEGSRDPEVTHLLMVLPVSIWPDDVKETEPVHIWPLRRLRMTLLSWLPFVTINGTMVALLSMAAFASPPTWIKVFFAMLAAAWWVTALGAATCSGAERSSRRPPGKPLTDDRVGG